MVGFKIDLRIKPDIEKYHVSWCICIKRKTETDFLEKPDNKK
jgi:hypothetical protein